MSTAESRAAIIAILKANVPLNAVISEVYDGAVPEGVNPTFPYLVIGDSIETDFRTLSKNGDDHVLAVRAWGLKRVGNQWVGDSQIATILGLVKIALRGKTISVVGHRTARLKRESLMILPDPDPKIAAGNLQIRVVLLPI